MGLRTAYNTGTMARRLQEQPQVSAAGANPLDILQAGTSLSQAGSVQDPRKRQAAQQQAALGAASMIPGPVGAGAKVLGIASSMNPPTEVTAKVSGPSESSSFQRRLQALNEDPFEQLKAGTVALASAPPEIRKQYAEPLIQATFKAARERGMR